MLLQLDKLIFPEGSNEGLTGNCCWESVCFSATETGMKHQFEKSCLWQNPAGPIYRPYGSETCAVEAGSNPRLQNCHQH